jgi:hypothetical protein
MATEYRAIAIPIFIRDVFFAGFRGGLAMMVLSPFTSPIAKAGASRL